MSDVKIHVLRPRLPWRDGERLTECGLTAGSSVEALDRDDARAQAQEWGLRRASLLFCMTCNDTMSRWPTWENDPVGVMSRETSRHRELHGQLAHELVALGMLARAHTEEYHETLGALAAAVPIGDLRARGRYRRDALGL